MCSAQYGYNYVKVKCPCAYDRKFPEGAWGPGISLGCSDNGGMCPYRSGLPGSLGNTQDSFEKAPGAIHGKPAFSLKPACPQSMTGDCLLAGRLLVTGSSSPHLSASSQRSLSHPPKTVPSCKRYAALSVSRSAPPVSLKQKTPPRSAHGAPHR